MITREINPLAAALSDEDEGELEEGGSFPLPQNDDLGDDDKTSSPDEGFDFDNDDIENPDEM